MANTSLAYYMMGFKHAAAEKNYVNKLKNKDHIIAYQLGMEHFHAGARNSKYDNLTEEQIKSIINDRINIFREENWNSSVCMYAP